MRTETSPDNDAALDAVVIPALEAARTIARPHVIAVYGDDKHVESEAFNLLTQYLIGNSPEPWDALQAMAMNIAYFLRMSCDNVGDLRVSFANLNEWLQTGVQVAEREIKASSNVAGHA